MIPELLILDEPTTGVDPLSRRQFWSLISRMRAGAAGMSVIVATAYMEEAEQFDWLVAMDAGRVLATGSPAELKEQTGFSVPRRKLHRAAAGRAAARSSRPLRFRRARLATASRSSSPADLTRRFGDFTAVDRVDFTIARGEIFGFRRLERLRQDDDDENADRALPASAGDSASVRQADQRFGHGARFRVGYMSQSFSLYTELSVPPES